MTDLLRINDETISHSDFIRALKLNGQFDSLMEELLEAKIIVHTGRAMGVAVSEQEIQDRADQVRRVMKLHRAVDMNRWLDEIGVSLEDFEHSVVETLYIDKTLERVLTDDAIEEYYRLNSPKFEVILLSHIVVDSEGKAREIRAMAEDDPESFESLAQEHSLADTRTDGGYIGKVARGTLISEVEAKVFHAAAGEVVGPFASADDGYYEVFLVNDKRPPTLDESTRDEIRRLIKQEWLTARARELRIELC